MANFTLSTKLPYSPEQLFSWHERGGAFTRLNPPWAPVTVLSKEGHGLGVGVKARVRVPLALGITQEWEHYHDACTPPISFRDIQTKGLFSQWEHTHSFNRDASSGETSLTDSMDFRFPFAPLSHVFAESHLRKELARLFTYRHAVTKSDLDCITRYNAPPRTILVTGGSGYIGSQLVAFLRCAGHTVYTTSRSARGDSSVILWREGTPLTIPPHIILDAVIHLAGEPVASGRWSTEKKKRMRESRVAGTRALVDALTALPTPPKVLISASAIGIFGDRGDELLTEESSAGSGFLADIATAWEQEAQRYAPYGRVCCARIGIVLSPDGGALGKMLLPFLCGVGGKLGNGKQWMSWIGRDDALYALYHLLCNEQCSGAFTLTAPEPVTNNEFTKTLGRVITRPTFAAIPRAVLIALFGEMAEAVLLQSTRAIPEKLCKTGFLFTTPHLEGALLHYLGYNR
jgi:uncharacterized protein (TIGR01777 family)